eukprot:2098490-Pleurochrysis_carterae.AAC.5
MVFVKCYVTNPEFDSQSKERLSTPAKQFNADFKLDRKFVRTTHAQSHRLALLHSHTLLHKPSRTCAYRMRMLKWHSRRTGLCAQLAANPFSLLPQCREQQPVNRICKIDGLLEEISNDHASQGLSAIRKETKALRQSNGSNLSIAKVD